jgi:RNA polymerase sigma factor (TIGR02999 family)
MGEFRRGNRDSAGKLVEFLYPQLRRLAASQMRHEGPEHTWQATALVNELYLELIKIKGLEALESYTAAEESAFMGLAAQIMRRLLIHHSRPLSKRTAKDSLSRIADEGIASLATLTEVEDVLRSLEQIDTRLRRVVELHVFEGLTGEETADRLGCSHATVKRDWRFARGWLAREFAPGAMV